MNRRKARKRAMRSHRTGSKPVLMFRRPRCRCQNTPDSFRLATAMSENALQIVAKDRSDASIKIKIFLCHNSKDKLRITQIADALELDFGTPFFLDVYAIPPGRSSFLLLSRP